MLLRTGISPTLPSCLRPRAALGLDGAQDFFGRDWQIIDPHADGIEDRIRDRRKYGIGAHLARTLRAERTIGGRAFQHRDVVRADVAGPRHQIFDEVAWPVP